ncbi:hypothetical protein B0H14DRAFT_3128880 [Mycena olivaceomarginata]|nr:hypothetical protein B0H14DRAFT_3128880 [Mycena olivaceomarginata]
MYPGQESSIDRVRGNDVSGGWGVKLRRKGRLRLRAHQHMDQGWMARDGEGGTVQAAEAQWNTYPAPEDGWDGPSFTLPAFRRDGGWAQRMRPSIRCRAVVAGMRRSRPSPCYRAKQGYTGNTQVLTLLQDASHMTSTARASHSPGGVRAAGRIDGLARSVWKHRQDDVDAFKGTGMCPSCGPPPQVFDPRHVSPSLPLPLPPPLAPPTKRGSPAPRPHVHRSSYANPVHVPQRMDCDVRPRAHPGIGEKHHTGGMKDDGAATPLHTPLQYLRRRKGIEASGLRFPRHPPYSSSSSSPSPLRPRPRATASSSSLEWDVSGAVYVSASRPACVRVGVVNGAPTRTRGGWIRDEHDRVWAREWRRDCDERWMSESGAGGRVRDALRQQCVRMQPSHPRLPHTTETPSPPRDTPHTATESKTRNDSVPRPPHRQQGAPPMRTSPWGIDRDGRGRRVAGGDGGSGARRQAGRGGTGNARPGERVRGVQPRQGPLGRRRVEVGAGAGAGGVGRVDERAGVRGARTCSSTLARARGVGVSVARVVACGCVSAIVR